NVNAANALLKTLEEPSPGALLILVSHQLSRLPATVLSRCQHIVFPRPATEAALAWLAPQLAQLTVSPELVLRLANGAPLAALRMAQGEILAARRNLLQIMSQLKNKQADPLQSAAALQELDGMLFLDFILSWIFDLMRMQLGCEAGAVLNQDFAAELTGLLHTVRLGQAERFLDYLQ